MSDFHLPCDSEESTESASTFTPRFLKSPERLAASPSSVVHTGVKSLGCEKNTAQELPSHLWNSIFPCEESAVKSGAMSPRRRLAGSVVDMRSPGARVRVGVRPLTVAFSARR